MKLIIQIPCLNEESTLPSTLAALPKAIHGVSRIEVQIINDGSSDRTVEIARNYHVDHVVSFKHRRGLAAAFKAGLDNAVQLGADILVNTDGDGQYKGECIADLVQPIVRGEADMVIGARDIKGHPEFSWIKKQLQRFGSWVVCKISGAEVQDAASGFRAYNQTAMLHLNIFSTFSYTMETLIHAAYQNLKIVSVPIRTNAKTRDSRLFRNIFHYLWKSGWTIIHVFFTYRSEATFNILSVLSLLSACFLTVRYAVLTIYGGVPHAHFWPSVILAGCLFILSIQFYLAGIQCILISSNRKLLEETVARLRKQDRHPDESPANSRSRAA